MLSQFGSTPIGVWTIKHLITPVQRSLYRMTGGRFLLVGGSAKAILLLTTTGRHSGQEHTTPVYYLRDGDQLVLCNVNPGSERTNPWVLNLRAHPRAKIQIGRTTGEFKAHEASDAEIARYWLRFLRLWPAYQTHFERSGKRTMFILEPI